MLRSLNQKGANGDGLLGSPFWGVLASELPTGGSQPGLLDNDVLAGDAADTRYRLRITSQPSAGVLFVQENGAFSFEGAPDGSYSAGQMVEKYDPATNTGSTDIGTISLLIGAVTTQVSSDLIITYEVQAPAATQSVSSDLVITYSTLARVSSDLVLSWQLLGNSGMSFTPSAVRTLTVNPTSRVFNTAGEFWNLNVPLKPRGAKDPNSTIDITFDWGPWLADMGDATIAGVTFLLTGVQDGGQYAQGSKATIFVSGGTGSEASILCRVTTATTPARTEDRTVYLDLKEQ